MTDSERAGPTSRSAGFVRSHVDLDVYKKAFSLAMSIFDATKSFPKEETCSLTDQIRRSSRSVCANLAEAWRKRRYEAAFVSRLDDAETEAAETQVWLQFAVKCGHLDRVAAAGLCGEYDEVLAMLVALVDNPRPWLLARTVR